MLHTSEGSIDGEFDGEMRLKRVLPLFSSAQYPVEAYHNFWRDIATTQYAGSTADRRTEAEVPSVASELNP